MAISILLAVLGGVWSIGGAIHFLNQLDFHGFDKFNLYQKIFATFVGGPIVWVSSSVYWIIVGCGVLLDKIHNALGKLPDIELKVKEKE